MDPPEKPADWKKPEKKYGGWVPQMIALPGGDENPEAPTVRPDLSSLCHDVITTAQDRKAIISAYGYCMKVRDTCPLPCCQYLHSQEGPKKVIVKKIIRRRRRRPKVAQEQALTNGQTPQQQEAAAAQEQMRQQQEAAMRYAEEQRRQQQEAELRRQQEEEYQRQQQAAAEQERQRQLQQQREEEDERQRQAQAAAAAAAAAPPAAPTQKVATFSNLGTDPAMAQAELYYESTRWGPLGHGDPPVTVGSFPGHRWFIVANGVYAKLFTVGEEEQQSFTI